MIRATAAATAVDSGAEPSGITVVGWTEYRNEAESTSATITKPAGIEDGDVLLIFAGWDDDAGVMTGPSGFIELGQAVTGVGRDGGWALFRKVVTDAGSEPADYTVTMTDSDEIALYCLAARGVDNTTPEDVAAVLNTPSGAGTSHPSPEITTVTDGALVVRFFAGTRTTSGLDLAVPAAPLGAISDVQDESTGTGDQTLAFQHFILDTAGGSGTDAFTVAATNNVARAVTVALRPATEPSGPEPGLHIWLTGNSSVTANVFANAGEEACADAIESLGHTVTRFNAGSITAAPTLTDCDVFIHINGSPGGETVLRGTDTNAAPVIVCNPYSLGNSWGSAALTSGAAGTDASDDQWQILNLSPGWTDGYAINDIPVIAGFDLYQERIWNAVAGGLAFFRTPAANHNVCWGFPVGTTNLASASLVARVVAISIFDGIQNLNAAGLQVFDDLIAWAAA